MSAWLQVLDFIARFEAASPDVQTYMVISSMADVVYLGS